MGLGFDRKTMAYHCRGDFVTRRLDHVFAHPGSPQFRYAQAHALSYFGAILPIPGNWKDLLVAYIIAGVDARHELQAWCAYLEQLGSGLQGPLNIYAIAQARFNALNSNIKITTTTQGAGGPVVTTPGTIVSPCPPT